VHTQFTREKQMELVSLYKFGPKSEFLDLHQKQIFFCDLPRNHLVCG
jgi:hypothetical protein